MRIPKFIILFVVSLCCYACGGNSASDAGGTKPVLTFANLSTVNTIEIGYDFTNAVAVTSNDVLYGDRTLGLNSVTFSDPMRLTLSSTTIDPFHSVFNLNGYDVFYGLIMAGNVAVLSVNSACLGMCIGDRRELRLYDISMRSNPTLLSTLAIPADYVVAENNLLYLTRGNSVTNTNNLVIVDISKPSTPVVLSTTLVSDAGPLTKNSNMLYISQIDYYEANSEKYKKIQVIDISDPSAPTVDAPPSGYAYNLTYSPIIVKGAIVYYLDSYGLNVVDMADKNNPVLVKTISLSNSGAKSFAEYNNKLHIAATSQGVMVFDISQPNNPVYLKSLKSQTDALFVAVSGGVGAYISDTQKQSTGGGYTTIKGYMMNLYFDR